MAHYRVYIRLQSNYNTCVYEYYQTLTSTANLNKIPGVTGREIYVGKRLNLARASTMIPAAMYFSPPARPHDFRFCAIAACTGLIVFCAVGTHFSDMMILHTHMILRARYLAAYARLNDK